MEEIRSEIIFVLEDFIEINNVMQVLPLVNQFISLLNDLEQQVVIVSNFPLVDSSLAFEIDLTRFIPVYLTPISEDLFFEAVMPREKKQKEILQKLYKHYDTFFISVDLKKKMLEEDEEKQIYLDPNVDLKQYAKARIAQGYSGPKGGNEFTAHAVSSIVNRQFVGNTMHFVIGGFLGFSNQS